MTVAALSHTSLPEFELLKRGKVRDVYTVDEDHLLIVATDRISAFDSILPTPIPRKGEVLTSLSRFWFESYVTSFLTILSLPILSECLPLCSKSLT